MKLFNVRYTLKEDAKERLALVLATCELMARATLYDQHTKGMLSVDIIKIIESEQKVILLWKEA